MKKTYEKAKISVLDAYCEGVICSSVQNTEIEDYSNGGSFNW